MFQPTYELHLSSPGVSTSFSSFDLHLSCSVKISSHRAIPSMEPISHLQDQDSPNDESNADHDLQTAWHGNMTSMR